MPLIPPPIDRAMIPKAFYANDVPAPRAKNVGELRALLSRLPDDLRVSIGLDEIVELQVYNLGQPDEHLALDSALPEDDEAGADDDLIKPGDED